MRKTVLCVSLLLCGQSVVNAADPSGSSPIAVVKTDAVKEALGVRDLQPRANRHALIIGIGRYADPAIPPLPGVRFDKESATQMALSMQVPGDNIRYLQNEEATADGIRQAVKELTNRIQDGDRVFIHYSGHGARYKDPVAGGCVESLLPYDGSQNGGITNHEMASMLQTITHKADKLFVMYDACHSGGVVKEASVVRTRGFSNPNGEGRLRPKFAGISEECSRPVNIRTRSLEREASNTGALPQDIIHISAARDNEISFDDELKGGLATQFMRDCMLRDAKDLDNSGAISIDEIKRCAQEKIDLRMANDSNFKPHNLVLNGNTEFVPTWFSQGGAAAHAAPLTGEQALRQLLNQRDGKRQVQITLSKDSYKIKHDTLDFSVQSDRTGYLYVAIAGSDNQSIHLLFPNDLDQENKIEAGQRVNLPRSHWQVQAAGPVGTDNLLAIVTDSPRNLAALANNKAGPFVFSLNDPQGRAQLGALMGTSATASGPACAVSKLSQPNRPCSDAYGAFMVAVKETE